MNGRGSARVSPSIVTWCSCIASSSALCVLAGARLISSPSTTFAKIGPSRRLNVPSARREHVRAGDVRRQQVGRELDALEARSAASRRTPWPAWSWRRRARPRAARGRARAAPRAAAARSPRARRRRAATSRSHLRGALRDEREAFGRELRGRGLCVHRRRASFSAARRRKAARIRSPAAHQRVEFPRRRTGSAPRQASPLASSSSSARASRSRRPRGGPQRAARLDLARPGRVGERRAPAATRCSNSRLVREQRRRQVAPLRARRSARARRSPRRVSSAGSDTARSRLDAPRQRARRDRTSSSAITAVLARSAARGQAHLRELRAARRAGRASGSSAATLP